MAGTPFTVYGQILDSDGTTTLANVRVSIQNVTKNESADVVTDSGGNYQYELQNLASGHSIGDSISIYSSYGRYYDESVFNTTSTDNGTKQVNLTLDNALSTSAVYCSVQDVRDFSNVQVAEYSNNAMMKMIRFATETIDQRTARTWKGIQTVTNELYNGDDTDILTLTHPDIQSVTAISIDDDGDGTYTSVTANKWFIDNADGGATSMIVLDTINANLTNFTAGVNTVKVSYTWGFATPTEEVKMLAVLMVCQMINPNSDRQRDIDARVRRLAYSGPCRPV